MLHVILLILKIIGIILLAVIGLLLLIILTVLLVPIRYRAVAEHGEDLLRVDASASWLLHLLHARITHLEGVLHINVKVLWITLYDNLQPKNPAEKTKVEKKRKKDKVNNKASDLSEDNKSRRKEETNRITETKKDSSTNVQRTKDADELINKPVDITKTEPKSESKPEPVQKQVLELRQSKENRPEDKPENGLENKPEISPENKPENKPNNKPEQIQTTKPEEKQPVQLEVNISKDQEQKEDKESIFHKFFMKIKNLKDRIKAFFAGLKDKIVNILKTAANIKHKIHLILEFIKDEYNRQGFKITYRSLRKILKHILPRKLKSRIVFGTGDPCSTGQALGAMGILYSFYGDRIQIIPDFENKIFEGKHYARGRIRLVTLLIIVIKLILDKRFKQLKNNFQILKEAL